jgi:hypothetical protein
MEESDMTDSANVEMPTGRDLSMSVVGYRVSYDRSLLFVEHFKGPPELVMFSGAKLVLTVQGATVEHHQNRPIRFAHLSFGEGPFDPNRAGRLFDLGPGVGVNIIATLPRADFPAFWAALGVEREATLVCTIALGADGLGTDRVLALEITGNWGEH